MTGWGTTSYQGPGSDTLMKVRVTPVEDKVCRNIFQNYFSNNMMCVGGDGATDSCQVDEGTMQSVE